MKDDKLLKSLEDPLTGGAIYSAVAVVSLIASFIFLIIVQVAFGGNDVSGSDGYIYASFLVPQICFFCVSAFSIRRTQTPLKEVYRTAGIKYFLIAVLLQYGLLSVSGLNDMFISFLNEHGLASSSSVSLPSLNGVGVAFAILCIAVLPAVFEETIFRSLMLSSMKKLGTAWCVIMSGLLFSLFHCSPLQTIYQFICGCAFALVAIRSGSVLPTMLSHFLNNAFIIISYKFGLESISHPAVYITSGVCLASSLVVLFADKNGNKKGEGDKKQFLYGAAAGILLCAVQWIAGLLL